MNARTIVAFYLVLQAAGTAAWWLLLLSIPTAIRWFQPAGWPDHALLGFWLADGLLLVIARYFLQSGSSRTALTQLLQFGCLLRRHGTQLSTASELVRLLAKLGLHRP